MIDVTLVALQLDYFTVAFEFFETDYAHSWCDALFSEEILLGCTKFNFKFVDPLVQASKNIV